VGISPTIPERAEVDEDQEGSPKDGGPVNVNSNDQHVINRLVTLCY
jgi:hypothetical protein